jgi:PAS domain S-box-containing protein
MVEPQFNIAENQINKLFPFYILIDRYHHIKSFGSSLAKVVQLRPGQKLSEIFTIQTPDLDKHNGDEITGTHYQLIRCLDGAGRNPILLQGELLSIKDSGDIFFLGSPKVNRQHGISNSQRRNNTQIYHEDIFSKSSGVTTTESYSLLSGSAISPFDSTENIKGAAITDAKGAIEWVDRDFERTTGYQLHEVIGLRPRQVIYGSRSTHIPKSYVDEMVKLKEPFSFDNIGYNRRNASFWFRTTVQPILNSNNEVKGRYYSFEDVTSLKENESALRETQELWKFAMDGAGDGVWFYDLIRSDLQVSLKFKEILGWQPKEAYRIEDFIASMQPEDLEHIRSGIIRRFTKSEPTFSYELQLKTKNGQPKYYKSKGKVIEWAEDGRARIVFGTLTDINEEKLKDIEIREQREYYQRILNELPADVIILSPDQKFRFLNKSAVKDDWMREWLIGKDMYDYCRERNLPTDLADSRKKIFDEATARRVASKEVDRRVKPDGTEEYKLRFLYPFLDKDENVDFLVGFGIDITEQVLNEKKLIEQKEYYHNILDAIPADIAILSPDHKYEFVNRSAVRDPEMRKWIIGKDDYDYCARRNLPPAIADGRRAKFLDVLATNESTSFIDEISNDDGTSIFKLRFFHPHTSSGGALKFLVGYGVDITEQVKNKRFAELQEERLRMVLNMIRDGVFTFDEGGHINFINNSFRHILNIADSNTDRPLSFFDLLPAAEIIKVKQKLSQLIQTGQPQYGIIHFIDYRGQIAYLDFSLTKAIGSIEAAFVGRISDITEIVNKEEGLKQIIAKEKELNLSKSRFVKITSHELRTPLAIILANAEILEMIQNARTHGTSNLDPAVMLKRIIKEVTIMTDILDQLMTISRIEADNIEFKRQTVDLPSFFTGIKHDLFDPHTDGRVLELHIAAEVTAASIDKNLTRQAVVNLVNNAYKYSPGKPAPVMQVGIENRNLVISVTDQGLGIPAEEQGKLFTSFFRATNVVNIQGTGLGLIVVDYAVKKHSGAVTFKSQQHEGTTFSISFPL